MGCSLHINSCSDQPHHHQTIHQHQPLSTLTVLVYRSQVIVMVKMHHSKFQPNQHYHLSSPFLILVSQHPSRYVPPTSDLRRLCREPSSAITKQACLPSVPNTLNGERSLIVCFPPKSSDNHLDDIGIKMLALLLRLEFNHVYCLYVPPGPRVVENTLFGRLKP
ncbi:hypothetical protein EJ06DRAFT_239469 [Trichodelitschia bisporula]|uniref:Uncharacterized protein n=1 Tax=Trichodelitschia bisporula TaxID=703511 RepID=A0A6G1HKB7_9PEZI|nr:hypothetical protein EJ06DRAFT_239469 [Trichodelitschia bisporula]